MSLRHCALALASFGAATLASGLYRYLSAPDGEKGLWFGIVMGSVALGAACSLIRGYRILGIGLGGFAIATVGGWFVYEALILKGVARAELRQLVLIVIAVVVGGMLVRFGWMSRFQGPPAG